MRKSSSQSIDKQMVNMSAALPAGVVVRQIDHPTYQRLIVDAEDSEVTRRDIIHKFAPTINMRTGDIWIDCTPRKLRNKFIWLSFARPIHAAIKTLYHATGVSSVHEVSKYFRRDNMGRRLQNGRQTFRNIGRCIVDVARTPVYSIAMEVMHIIGVFSATVKPTTAYRMREMSGNLESRLNRNLSPWVYPQFRYLGPCLNPAFNIYTIHTGRKRSIDKWKAEHKRGCDGLSDQAIALKTWAQVYANFAREHSDCAFGGDCRPLGRGVAYTSPILLQYPEDPS